MQLTTRALTLQSSSKQEGDFINPISKSFRMISSFFMQYRVVELIVDLFPLPQKHGVPMSKSQAMKELSRRYSNLGETKWLRKR